LIVDGVFSEKNQGNQTIEFHGKVQLNLKKL